LLIHYKIKKYLNSINYTYTYFITSINQRLFSKIN
jgi:hypothetical protein